MGSNCSPFRQTSKKNLQVTFLSYVRFYYALEKCLFKFIIRGKIIENQNKCFGDLQKWNLTFQDI